MSRARKAAPVRSKRLKVGDRVRFTWVRDKLEGTIIEERGPIGAGGRRLYTVSAVLAPPDEIVLELPEDEIQAA